MRAVFLFASTVRYGNNEGILENLGSNWSLELWHQGEEITA